MKLATYKDGSRDGQLVVVSKDLRWAHFATNIVSSLQHALEDWSFFAPQLQNLSEDLDSARARYAFAFDPGQCMAPLPRAYQWVCADAYTPMDGGDTATLASSAAIPWAQCSGSSFVAPRSSLPVPQPAQGDAPAFSVDVQSGLAVACADVQDSATPEQAMESIRLLMLYGQVVWMDGEGRICARPQTAFAPLAVSLEDVGESWNAARADFSVQIARNGRKVGLCNTARDMAFDFGELLAHANCRRARVKAGTVLGAGPVRNPGEGLRGVACIADKRRAEQRIQGAMRTACLNAQDQWTVEVENKAGETVFGAIALRFTEEMAP